jgi:chemotaxis-related protein WspD
MSDGASIATGLFERPLPPGYRDELRALVAERPAAHKRSEGSVLLFQLGEMRLGLPTRVAAAVAPVLHIARIPHRSGTVLLGLAAFRGEILPCCSLSKILDLPETAGGEGRAESATARTLILEESPGRRWAVPIDGVLGVRIRRDNAGEGAAVLGPQWLQGSFTDEAGMYHLLDPEVVFRQITLATA